MIISPANGGELHVLRGDGYTVFSIHQSLKTGEEKKKEFFGLTDDDMALLASLGKLFGFFVTGSQQHPPPR